MRGWLQIFGAVLFLHALLTFGMAALFGELDQSRTWRLATRLLARVRRPRAVVVPLRRPIEDVSADLRRLRASFRRDGLRFAKYEGCRQAYDGVLAEAADMAGLAHLMEVLPPGSELDRERQRVEMLLQHHGLLPPPYAA